MWIQMICPAPPGSLYGNRITALRWARILRRLGHRLTLAQRYDREPCDLLVALHARRSADSALAFRKLHPDKPLLVILTGTDVYRDIHRSRKAQRALEAATRLVVLQPLAIEELDPRLRPKARVIYQSAPRTGGRSPRRGDTFDVCILGHLRYVKDPFRAAYAARLLPASSRIRILHAGQAMDEAMARRAHSEMHGSTQRSTQHTPRYTWLGEIPRAQARRLIRSSRLMVLSSRMEGGANVISEALVDHTPVLASRIPGSVGLLGKGYPGYFPVGDTAALARLLRRAESDARFYAKLKTWCIRLAPRFHPSREQAAWERLLREV